MERKPGKVEMEIGEAIQSLFDEVSRLNDIHKIQNQMIYELCRAFITVGSADPESLIQVIKGCCNTSDLHPNCATIIDSLTAAIEKEFVTQNDTEHRPKLRLVTDSGRAPPPGPQEG